RVEPHRLGIDRDRRAEIEPVGKIAAVQLVAHGATPRRSRRRACPIEPRRSSRLTFINRTLAPAPKLLAQPKISGGIIYVGGRRVNSAAGATRNPPFPLPLRGVRYAAPPVALE